MPHRVVYAPGMQSGILTDRAIKKQLKEGRIEIEPYNEEQLNPVSYDLTLGDEVRVYNDWVVNGYKEWGGTYPGGYPCPDTPDGVHLFKKDGIVDVKKEPTTTSFKIDPEHGWLLKPGIGYLMHTRERIKTNYYVPIIDGKSSVGRLFLQVHITAGFGDPGFNGQYTLEVVVTNMVRVYPGMRICQIRF